MTDTELYFRFRCEKGLAKRGLAGREDYEKRLQHEIATISNMGFCGYFLIVSDIVRWAINNKVPVGPGRGSAGGSLVSYVLEITHLDPIKYGLIFERFLNPERISMPDIDLDFCEEHRSDVIHYIENKYGKDKVAHIGTYGTMKAKAAIRDVTRVLGYEYTIGDKLANMILPPIEGKTQSLAVCYEKVPALHNLKKSPVDTAEKKILDWADRFEDRIRSFGTHASGIVISDRPISEIIPLYPGKDKATTTQFEMYTVEECGLIKFDLLGLSALTTINRCIKSIEKRHRVIVDPLEIPVDDEATYLNLQQGDVEGIFQLEGSSGIRDLLVQIRPKCLEDIATLVALYRPGPLGSPELQRYLQVRAGITTPNYYDEALKPILQSTDGLLIYQEQVLEICKQLAGYSMGEADLMRRAVGKKKEKEMAAQEQQFKQGMAKNGFVPSIADQLWNDIKAFASYGFNKSHAACYAYISYQMAWLKTHYPLEFLCSCLVADAGIEDKIIRYISHCKTKGINILPPSVNESELSFSITPDGHNIRFGLAAIKNVGKSVDKVIKDRSKHGPYKSILDFSNRLGDSTNKKQLEVFVLSGAFDGLGYTRASMLAAIEDIARYREEYRAFESKLETFSKKSVNFEQRKKEIAEWEKLTPQEAKEKRKLGFKKPTAVKMPERPVDPRLASIPNIPELPLRNRLQNERELLGCYISGHPLDSIKELTQFDIATIKSELEHQSKATLIAVPTIVKEITTKKDKKKMAFLALEDKTGTIQCVVFPKTYLLYQNLIDIGVPARYHVIVEITEGDKEEDKVTKLIITKIELLTLSATHEDNNIDIILPLNKAFQASKKIHNLSGHGVRLNLMIKSNHGTFWQFGQFDCIGNRSSILEALKDYL